MKTALFSRIWEFMTRFSALIAARNMKRWSLFCFIMFAFSSFPLKAGMRYQTENRQKGSKTRKDIKFLEPVHMNKIKIISVNVKRQKFPQHTEIILYPSRDHHLLSSINRTDRTWILSLPLIRWQLNVHWCDLACRKAFYNLRSWRLSFIKVFKKSYKKLKNFHIYNSHEYLFPRI